MNIKTMESKVKVWIARDRNGSIFAFSERPNKYKCYWAFAPSMQLDKSIFPSVKWEDDEPTEAYLTLAEPQEQPKQEQPTQKQEIDWEQLRFKIANDVIAEYVSKIYFDEFENNIQQHIETTNKLVDLAINLSIKITNILMGELKSNIK